MNTELLLKLMRMTTSDNDGEALVAIRKANAMLAAEKKDWEDLIVRSSQVRSQDNSFRTPPSQRKPPPSRNPYADAWKRANPRPRTRPEPDSDLLDSMLDVVLAEVDLSSSFYDLVRSIKRQFDEKGTISERQAEVVRNAYNRAMKNKRGQRAR